LPPSQQLLGEKMKAVVLVLALSLVGCASTPKAVLTKEQHMAFAIEFLAVSECSRTGKMPVELASFAQSRVVADLRTWDYDDSLMKAHLSGMKSSGYKFTDDQCHYAYMKWAEKKRVADEDKSRAPAVQNYQFQPNRQTYCNRIGNQTFCNTM
jgi:hypothetical protein